MAYGIGRGFGSGYGRGMGRGFRRGFGRGLGRGFGFRGSSPPWPYVGIGRGGLPRGAYYFDNMSPPAPWPDAASAYSFPYGSPNYAPGDASMSKEDELNYLKDQAEAIKQELERIDMRMQEIEKD